MNNKDKRHTKLIESSFRTQSGISIKVDKNNGKKLNMYNKKIFILENKTRDTPRDSKAEAERKSFQI